MAVLLDTGILYAYYDRSDRWHLAATQLLRAEVGGLLVPAPVLPELDHLLEVRLGVAARHLFYRGLTEGNFLIVDVPQALCPRIVALDQRFADLRLGFVDCAIAALAESRGLRRIATTDRRHFEPLATALNLELTPTPPSAP